MSERAPMLADRTALVDRYVTELSLLAKEGSPEAVIEVLLTHDEDEDAHLLVYLPEGTSETSMDQLRDVLLQRSIEILEEVGLLILVGVYERSEE